MTSGYSEFCPIAKASEIFAMRWTPLILRELMCDAHTFNDIHRGVPLISRALLAERLRQLDEHGIIEKKSRLVGSGCEYRLTPAGYAFHDALRALAQWGLLYGRDRLSTEDLNPGLLMWRIRRRADTKALPKNRVVVRFEFSGVPPSRTRLRTMWLILERPGADVCLRDPGFPVDLTVHGDIAVLIAIYLGYESWKDMVGCKKLRIEDDRRMAHQLPTLLRLDKLLGRDYRPLARQAARAS